MFYQQQQQQAFQPDFRQLLNRLNEKVDTLNEKVIFSFSELKTNPTNNFNLVRYKNFHSPSKYGNQCSTC
jgi:hypothetical protein